MGGPDNAELREHAESRARIFGDLIPCYGAGFTLALLDRLEAAEQRLAAVRALANEWDTERANWVEPALRGCAADLRAAPGETDSEAGG